MGYGRDPALERVGNEKSAVGARGPKPVGPITSAAASVRSANALAMVVNEGPE